MEFLSYHVDWILCTLCCAMDDVLMRSKEEAKEQEAKKAYSRPEKSLKNHGFSEMSKKVQRGKGDRCSRDHL